MPGSEEIILVLGSEAINVNGIDIKFDHVYQTVMVLD